MRMLSRFRARKPRRRPFLAVEALDARVVPATIGVVDPTTATWFLRGSNDAGVANAGTFPYGVPGWGTVTGDWDGNGTDTVGAVDPDGEGGATWYLRNSNSEGSPDIAPFAYGLGGWTSVAGDWDGDGTSTIGVVDPETGTWYLRNENSAGAADASFAYGLPGWIAVVGDWDGDGTETIGVVDPETGTWYLRNENSEGAPDLVFQYGLAGWTPVAGDWDDDGTTTIATVDPASNTWYIRNENSAGSPDIAPFDYGAPGWTPLAGDWALSPAEPIILADNLDQTPGATPFTIQNQDLFAINFETDASAYELNSVTLLMALTSQQGGAVVQIFANGATGPGTELIGTLTSPTTYSSTPEATTFTADEIVLEPETTYWVVVVATGGGTVEWSQSTTATGTGDGFVGEMASSTTGGLSWLLDPALPGMLRIEATETETPGD